MRDLSDKVLPGASLNRGFLKVREKALYDGLDVDIVGHFEEQVKSLDFERVISVLKTVYDEGLVLKSVLWVDLDDAGQTGDSNVLQVVGL